ncbi:enoyl-CoA hydratase [Aestuariivirga sp.]|uniref:enoyl-CoA hydratase n=1 Tax=Aestuariivirga sp. TaxID=2650926 RepID=UPI003593F8B9
MTDLLLSDLEGGVLRLTLNDAATRNSLSEAMMAGLQAALDAAATDRAVRVIVLAANGPAFSSGHNLKEITGHRADPDKGAAYFAALFDACAKLMMSVVRHPKPVIAEVAGLASAAGCQLVASCDLAIAADTARFCTPGVNIGLFCSTPMVALSRDVVPKHAMEMLLTGDIFDAAHAARIGLVNRVVTTNELSGTVSELAAKIASKSMVTVKTGKEAFYRQLDLPLEEAYAYTSRVMTDNLLKRDAEEGISAFIGKRPPQWNDE